MQIASDALPLFKRGQLAMDWGLLFENFYFAVFVGVALCLERRRWRPKRRLPPAAAVLLTLLLVYLGVRSGTVVGWLLGS